MKFTAVAFDLDGTLYPDYSLNFRLIPFILREQRLLRAMGRARKKLRASDMELEGISQKASLDFYEAQAGLMAKDLRKPAAAVKEKLETLVYRGWEPIFKKIRLFPHVRDTLDALRRNRVKLGLLSDFPPEEKLKNLNIFEYWDTIVCSELTGHLKPDSTSFLELAGAMKMKTEEILYVGNSVPYDVYGAKKTGMKAALVLTGPKKIFPVSCGGPSASSFYQADFCFCDYRQLSDYVLN